VPRGQRLAGAYSSASLCSSTCPLAGVSRAAINRSLHIVSAPGQTESPPPPMNCSNLQVVSGGTSLARFHAGRPQRPPPQASKSALRDAQSRSSGCRYGQPLLTCPKELARLELIKGGAGRACVGRLNGRCAGSAIGHRFGVTAPTGGGCPTEGGQTHLTGYG
jgi:hypothetical protein